MPRTTTRGDNGRAEKAGSRAPSQREIAERAYALWIGRGRLDGGALDDWMDAERQLVAEREVVRPAHGPRATRRDEASPVRSRAGLVSARRRVVRRRVVEPDLASK